MAIIAPSNSSTNLLPSRYGELKSEDFVKLIFTELRNQDPLKPNDSGELVKQIDSIRSIQTNMELGQQLNQVAESARLWGASDLIGRFVKGLTTDYLPASGKVIGIQQTSNGPLLELESGQFIPFSMVQSIQAQSASAEPASPAVPTAGDPGSGGSGGAPNGN